MKLGTILSAFLISIGNSDCNDGKVEFWVECYLINIQNLTNLMSVINIFSISNQKLDFQMRYLFSEYNIFQYD